MPKLPEITEPFATFGDTVEGETADAIAVNVLECAKVASIFRNCGGIHCKPKTPRPDLKRTFWGHKLTAASRDALARAEKIYDTFKWPEPKSA